MFYGTKSAQKCQVAALFPASCSQNSLNGAFSSPYWLFFQVSQRDWLFCQNSNSLSPSFSGPKGRLSLAYKTPLLAQKCPESPESLPAFSAGKCFKILFQFRYLAVVTRCLSEKKPFLYSLSEIDGTPIEGYFYANEMRATAPPSSHAFFEVSAQSYHAVIIILTITAGGNEIAPGEGGGGSIFCRHSSTLIEFQIEDILKTRKSPSGTQEYLGAI